MRQAILAENLTKRFRKTVALAGLDLEVPEGIVFGLLGPNGAGKTTAVRILATLLRPDAGHAYVGGHDVATDGAAVRKLIGLTGQYAALDEALTGHENLVLIGRLQGMRAGAARRRAWDLLELVDLAEPAGRPVRTYSGGMRRRVDLAASLVGHPTVLFLDEPTTGLDPASRIALWSLVTQTVAAGTSVLLTSQYLEEVDRLAARIAVVDHGRVIAEGTPAELKAQVGGQVVATHVGPQHMQQASVALEPIAPGQVRTDGDEVVVPVSDPTKLNEALGRLLSAGISVEEIALRRPRLDEVFLNLTARQQDAGIFEEVA